MPRGVFDGLVGRVHGIVSGVVDGCGRFLLHVLFRGGGQQIVLVRRGEGGWAQEPGGAVDAAVATHLDTAVKMLHRSGPVREIAPEELTGVDTRPFGLEDPVAVATLSGAGGQALTVRFGALNPEGFLQYMRIDGDPKVYLMSRFIGAEWTAALEGLKAR